MTTSSPLMCDLPLIQHHLICLHVLVIVTIIDLYRVTIGFIECSSRISCAITETPRRHHKYWTQATRLEIGMSYLLMAPYYTDKGTLVKNNTSLTLPKSGFGETKYWYARTRHTCLKTLHLTLKKSSWQCYNSSKHWLLMDIQSPWMKWKWNTKQP